MPKKFNFQIVCRLASNDNDDDDDHEDDDDDRILVK
jgi:hypothetical protein